MKAALLRGRDSGMALVTVLLVLMLASALMVGFFAAIAADQRAGGIDRDQTQAYAVAQAGLEKLTSDLASLFDVDFSPSAAELNTLGNNPPVIPGFHYTAPTGGSGYTVTFTPDANGNPKPADPNGTTISAGPYQGFRGIITPYDITVTAEGFKKYEAKGVVLDVAQKSRVDVALEVGATSAQITVEGTSVAQVETQSSDLTGVVTGKEISQLELNGRNFTQLITLVPATERQYAVSLWYAESESLVRFMIDRQGQMAFAQFLAGLQTLNALLQMVDGGALALEGPRIIGTDTLQYRSITVSNTKTTNSHRSILVDREITSWLSSCLRI